MTTKPSGIFRTTSRAPAPVRAALVSTGSGEASRSRMLVAFSWRNSEAAASGGSYYCGLGAELVLLLPALIWIRRRRRLCH